MPSKLVYAAALVTVVFWWTMHAPVEVNADQPPSYGYGGGPPTLGQVRWDLRGGEPAPEEPNGGEKGGQLYVSAINGMIVHEDGRARPANVLGINAFQAALADHKVTFAEISAMPWWNASAETLSLPSGYGAYLPSNATLDLSDTPVYPNGGIGSVRILAQDDVIVIAGDVVSGRATYDSVYLVLDSECPTTISAVAIVVTGAVNLDGKTGWSSIGANLHAKGSIIAKGSLSARGGQGSHAINEGHPGLGGIVGFVSDEGDVVLGSGSVDASGGKGGSGGSFLVVAESTGNDVFDWGLRADCGPDESGGGSGAQGGYLSAEFFVACEFKVRVIARGSASNGPNGGSGGGGAGIACHGTGTGHLYATLDGGAGGGAGGGAALVISHAVHTTLSGTANGGDSSVFSADGNSYGGPGGQIGIQCNTIDDCLIDFDCEAGDGIDSAREGGSFGLFADLTDGNTLTVDGLKVEFSGRAGNGAIPGDGGLAYVGARTPFEGTDMHIDIDVSSKRGASGGNAAIEVSSTLDGGVISGSFKLTAHNGGQIALYFQNCNGTFSGDYDLDAKGVTSSYGSGSGGFVRVNADPNTGFTSSSSFVGVLDISIAGADNTSTDIESGNAGGGHGGHCFLSCGNGGVFTCSTLTISANGGRSHHSRAGGGGTIEAAFMGDVLLSSGNISVAGGDGAASQSTGGGDGGAITLATAGHVLDIGVVLEASGGTANPSSGGNGHEPGRGGSITIDLNSANAATSGSLLLRSGANVRGGDSTGQSGGNGGTFTVLDPFATSGGPVLLWGLIDLTGGDSFSPANQGGAGGRVTVDVAGAISVFGSIIANGGNATKVGARGGDAYLPLNLGNNRAASLHLNSMAVIQANGGFGNTPTDRGQGGPILLDPVGTGTSNPNRVEDSGSSVTATGIPVGVITRD